MLYRNIISGAVTAVPVLAGLVRGAPHVANSPAARPETTSKLALDSCSGGKGETINIIVQYPGTIGVTKSGQPGSDDGSGIGSGAGTPAGQITVPGSDSTNNGIGSAGNVGGLIASNNGGSVRGDVNTNTGGTGKIGDIDVKGGNNVANGGSSNANGGSNNNNNNANASGGSNVNNNNNYNTVNNTIQLPPGYIGSPKVLTSIYIVTSGSVTATRTSTQTVVPQTSAATTSVPLKSATSTTSSSAVSMSSSTSSAACPLSTCAAGAIGASALSVVKTLNGIEGLIKAVISISDPAAGSPKGQAAGKQIGDGIADIVTAIWNAITMLKDVKPFDLECDATAVYYAAETALESFEALAGIAIGKEGVGAAVPILGPIITFGLRALAAPLEAIIGAVLELIPHYKLCTSGKLGDYKGTIGKAIGNPGKDFCYRPNDCALGKISESAQSVVDILDDLARVGNGILDISVTGTVVDTVALGTKVLAFLGQVVTNIGTLTSIKPFDVACDAYAISTALTKLTDIIGKVVDIIQKFGLYWITGSIGNGIVDTIKNVVTGLVKSGINIIPAHACTVPAKIGSAAAAAANAAIAPSPAA
ncbi:hypothetical protein LEL_08734 [Akanthomyces lecanii RCEF 1005]|uniref:Uncharacterized protein n=1 Tax=Akanthomyces lecanii RCEF 1005 TaxID=1081108 RepID=A0A168DSF5_CORDF|nr:hypothetical protein LEL_08734 [Akanthomyces lecanii RCEF 1005]